MSVINLLSPHVADLIAAGEVVERPASVIKELIENAFDAGAHNITCEIRNGGLTYIRVTDDGCGMAPEDAGIAFLRHATSKLSDESGLERISTMGFRGEALAAISSVSHIELITRQAGAAEGTRVLLDAGDIQDMAPFGCPEGTTMICRDIFYNTPARLKFMKSDRSEASACIAAALRCALGRPDVSVRFLRDGNEEFFSPGDGRVDSCLYALLGREEAASMLQCSSSSDALKVSGFIASPSEGRGNRAHQFFYVNGRYIKSALLQSALEQAYKNTLLVGRYPSCVLYLTLSFGSVDVNVHPAKTEIRFGAEKAVFDFVYQAVKLALEAEDRLSAPAEKKSSASLRTPSTEPRKPKSLPITYNLLSSEPQLRPCPLPSASSPSASSMRTPAAGKQFYQSMSADEFRGRVSVAPSGESVLRAPESSYASQLRMDLPSGRPASAPVPPAPPKAAEPADISSGKNQPVEKPVQNVEKPSVPDHKILGEAFRTYIIVEENGELLLIDKHAAHERMIFDRLKAAGSTISSQMLLVPAILHPSLEDAEVLEKNGELLGELGFEIELYGEKEYIVRGVPADMNASDVPAAVEEICEKIRTCKTPDPSSARDEILHTVACKAAIKAGWDTHKEELEKIVSAVLTGEIRYCPHGRPVSALITRKDLDKLFKRIV